MLFVVFVVFVFFVIFCFLFLSFTTLWANSGDNKLMTFFLVFQKTGFEISCKLSPLETICMKCQNLFSGKNKNNISVSHPLKILLDRVLSIKVGFAFSL